MCVFLFIFRFIHFTFISSHRLSNNVRTWNCNFIDLKTSCHSIVTIWLVFVSSTLCVFFLSSLPSLSWTNKWWHSIRKTRKKCTKMKPNERKMRKRKSVSFTRKIVDTQKKRTNQTVKNREAQPREQRPSIKITRHIYLYRTSLANFVAARMQYRYRWVSCAHANNKPATKAHRMENITLFLWVNWIFFRMYVCVCMLRVCCCCCCCCLAVPIFRQFKIMASLFGLVLHFIRWLFTMFYYTIE